MCGRLIRRVLFQTLTQPESRGGRMRFTRRTILAMKLSLRISTREGSSLQMWTTEVTSIIPMHSRHTHSRICRQARTPIMFLCACSEMISCQGAKFIIVNLKKYNLHSNLYMGRSFRPPYWIRAWRQRHVCGKWSGLRSIHLFFFERCGRLQDLRHEAVNGREQQRMDTDWERPQMHACMS